MDRQLLAEDTEINKLTIIEYLQMAAHGHWTLSILLIYSAVLISALLNLDISD